jgi:AcrR family transcriptional regulator
MMDAPDDIAGPAPAANLATRKGYHHGALREALLSAARKLIAEKGVAGFTLADASRLAGVSGAAPYRHFRDKDELVAEVARLGFQAFAERLGAAASAAAAHGGLAAFDAMGRAYLGFARTEPGAYAAMFAGGLRQGDAQLQGAGEQAFQTLIGGLMQAFGGAPPAGLDPVALAFRIWALAHGVAMLEQTHARRMGIDGEAALSDGVRDLLRPYLGHPALTPAS